MIYIGSFVLVIGVLVFVHELGHYLAARSVGVRIEKFSIGFPPRFISLTSIKDGWDITFFFFRFSNGSLHWGPVLNTNFRIQGRRGSGTEYVVALLPLGGYVKMAGSLDESLDTVVTNSPDEFMSKSVLQKIWILSAGVLMNVFTAFVIFFLLTYSQGIPEYNNEPIIGQLSPGGPAQEAGLEPGDKILVVNGEEIFTWTDLVDNIRPIPKRSRDFKILI